jgi:hypothetical protein
MNRARRSSGVAVAAEVEEPGAAAPGAHLGALGHHEVHEARAAPCRDEDVAGGAAVVVADGADGTAVVAGRRFVGGREGRECGRDRGAPAAGAAALLLFLVLLIIILVVAAVDVACARPCGGVRAHGRHGGVARRGAGGAGPAAGGQRRRGSWHRRGGECRRARINSRARAVLPVDVVNLPRLHKSTQTMYKHATCMDKRKTGRNEQNDKIAVAVQECHTHVLRSS